MNRIFRILALWPCFLFFLVFPVSGQEDKEQTDWTGTLENGIKITKEDLEKILSDHKRWLDTKKREGKCANLSRADLSKADMREVDLREANMFEVKLIDANLIKSKLSGVDLSSAKLNGAKMFSVNLKDAHLNWADLTNATLRNSDLSGASLNNADLSRADLIRADLSRADLSFAKMKEARLFDTQLKECLLWGVTEFPLNYEPKAGSTPYIPSIAENNSLSKFTFEKSCHGLVGLREGFKRLGFRKQEREITYAIKYRERQILWDSESIYRNIESLFNLFFFEITCKYGMKSGRIFWILFGFIIFFTIPYTAFILREGEDGIWKVWINDRIRKDIGTNEPERLYHLDFHAIRKGFYFSVLSAFGIGWRDFNVGNWIARIQRREYVLKATGWARFISGVQSLISVYFLALWVLTYFGRPFETF